MIFSRFVLFINLLLLSPMTLADEDLSPLNIEFILDSRRGFIYKSNQQVPSVEGGLVYRINSQGFRDDEPSTEKSLILVLGSSHTFGHAINEEDRWSNQLELKLKDFDVYNMGVAGYSVESIIVNAQDFLERSEYKIKLIIFEMPPHIDEYSLMKSFLWLQPKPHFTFGSGELTYHSPPQYFQKEFSLFRGLFKSCSSCTDLATEFDKFLFYWPQSIQSQFLRAYYKYSYYKLWVEVLKYSINLGKKKNIEVAFVVRDRESFQVCQKVHNRCINVEDIATRKYHVNSSMLHVNRKGNKLKMDRIYNSIKDLL